MFHTLARTHSEWLGDEVVGAATVGVEINSAASAGSAGRAAA